MKKFLILLIFNFSFLFSFGTPLEDTEDIFNESYEIVEPPTKAVIVQSMKVSTIDPALMRDEYSKKIIPLVYETLFTMDSEGRLKKSLVEDYRWLSDRELYIRLKSGIKFHDNSELTGELTKNSLNFLRGEGVLKNLYSEITDIKVLGKYEIVIKIVEEDNTFLNTLSYRVASIVKREKGKIFGTGSYKVVAIDGKKTKLQGFQGDDRNPPELKEIEFTWELDEKQRLIRLFNDSADIIVDAEKRTFQEGKDLGIVPEGSIVLPSSEIATEVVVFGNQNNCSLEMKKILERGITREADTFFPRELLDAQLSKIDISYKEKEIKKLAENVEVKELKLMILNTEDNMKNAEMIKSNLRKLGINVKILPHQIESYYNKLESKDYDMAIFTITTSSSDLVLLMTKILVNDIENIELYNALQPFFKIVKDEKDKDKRDAVIDKMASLIHKNMPYIVLGHHKHFTIISSKFEELLNKNGEVKNEKNR